VLPRNIVFFFFFFFLFCFVLFRYVVAAYKSPFGNSNTATVGSKYWFKVFGWYQPHFFSRESHLKTKVEPVCEKKFTIASCLCSLSLSSTTHNLCLHIMESELIHYPLRGYSEERLHCSGRTRSRPNLNILDHVGLSKKN